MKTIIKKNLVKNYKKKGYSARLLKDIKRDKYLYFLLALPIIYFILFKYLPMYGIILAFRRFIPLKSIFGVNWVGFRYFEMFFRDPSFWRAFKNTLILNGYNLIIGFPAPIIFALLLNEIRTKYFKRAVQTVSYLPWFFSTVVIVGIIKELLAPSSGVINLLLNRLGFESIFFLNQSEWFRTIFISSNIWQFMGQTAIIYLAALANVDPQLYEASEIDGATRLQQTRHITIPGILPTIIILFILQVGRMLAIGFEKVLLLYSPAIYETSDVIQTYVYRMGLLQSNYSYATAIGLFQGVIGLILIVLTNHLANKASETSLF